MAAAERAAVAGAAEVPRPKGVDGGGAAWPLEAEAIDRGGAAWPLEAEAVPTAGAEVLGPDGIFGGGPASAALRGTRSPATGSLTPPPAGPTSGGTVWGSRPRAVSSRVPGGRRLSVSLPSVIMSQENSLCF